MAKTSAVFGLEYFSTKMPVLQRFLPTEKTPSGGCWVNLEEVSWHDTPSDCWVVIYDRVYNLTDFLDEHPGGSDILLEYAGRDATLAFRGFRHSRFALKALDRFLVGELPVHERIFRKPDGIRLSDIPDRL